MEKPKEKDAFQASKEAEARILKLQAEVQHLQQRIQLSESEEKAEAEENEKRFNENKHLISKLQEELDELIVRRNRGLKCDERIVAKAFQKYSRDIGILSRKSGKEAVEYLDGKILDLIKRSNLLAYELKRKRGKLQKLKDQVQGMKVKKREANKKRQSETAVRIRELENEYMKVEKNLMECQVINSKYKAIQLQLRHELDAYPRLIDELEEEYEQQTEDVKNLAASEGLARERRDHAKGLLAKAESDAAKARLEKERIITEFGKALKPSQALKARPTTSVPEAPYRRQSTDLSSTEAAEELRRMRVQQEAEMKQMRKDFEKIKAAVGISDIEEAESRFLSQKGTVEELKDLVSRAEKRRQELMDELQDLRAKKENMTGAELARPQVPMDKEPKAAQEEEVKRVLAAEAEQKRIQGLCADVKSALWYQLQLMEKYASEKEPEPLSPDVSVSEITDRFESSLRLLLERLEGHDLTEIKNSLLDEQFLQKMDTIKFPSVPGSGPKGKQSDEEESSDEEDLEKKRTQLKKDAEVHAEVKKKQQGRGRMMML